MSDSTGDTRDEAYTDRLVQLGQARWKQVLNVQAPYRWNLRRLQLGRTLDVGCGTGRNLASLAPGSVGVDHNPTSVAFARSHGLTAFTGEEFHAEFGGGRADFEALLLAHVVEHMDFDVAVKILEEYRPYLRPQAQLVLICPQEAGYRSDHTHVRFFDLDGLGELCAAVGAQVKRGYSFPLPRPAGRAFRYNEFVVVARFTA